MSDRYCTPSDLLQLRTIYVLNEYKKMKFKDDAVDDEVSDLKKQLSLKMKSINKLKKYHVSYRSRLAEKDGMLKKRECHIIRIWDMLVEFGGRLERAGYLTEKQKMKLQREYEEEYLSLNISQNEGGKDLHTILKDLTASSSEMPDISCRFINNSNSVLTDSSRKDICSSLTPLSSNDEVTSRNGFESLKHNLLYNNTGKPRRAKKSFNKSQKADFSIYRQIHPESYSKLSPGTVSCEKEMVYSDKEPETLPLLEQKPLLIEGGSLEIKDCTATNNHLAPENTSKGPSVEEICPDNNVIGTTTDNHIQLLSHLKESLDDKKKESGIKETIFTEDNVPVSHMSVSLLEDSVPVLESSMIEKQNPLLVEPVEQEVHSMAGKEENFQTKCISDASLNDSSELRSTCGDDNISTTDILEHDLYISDNENDSLCQFSDVCTTLKSKKYPISAQPSTPPPKRKALTHNDLTTLNYNSEKIAKEAQCEDIGSISKPDEETPETVVFPNPDSECCVTATNVYSVSKFQKPSDSLIDQEDEYSKNTPAKTEDHENNSAAQGTLESCCVDDLKSFPTVNSPQKNVLKSGSDINSSQNKSCEKVYAISAKRCHDGFLKLDIDVSRPIRLLLDPNNWKMSCVLGPLENSPCDTSCPSKDFTLLQNELVSFKKVEQGSDVTETPVKKQKLSNSIPSTKKRELSGLNDSYTFRQSNLLKEIKCCQNECINLTSSLATSNKSVQIADLVLDEECTVVVSANDFIHSNIYSNELTEKEESISALQTSSESKSFIEGKNLKDLPIRPFKLTKEKFVCSAAKPEHLTDCYSNFEDVTHGSKIPPKFTSALCSTPYQSKNTEFLFGSPIKKYKCDNLFILEDSNDESCASECNTFQSQKLLSNIDNGEISIEKDSSMSEIKDLLHNESDTESARDCMLDELIEPSTDPCDEFVSSGREVLPDAQIQSWKPEITIVTETHNELNSLSKCENSILPHRFVIEESTIRDSFKTGPNDGNQKHVTKTYSNLQAVSDIDKPSFAELSPKSEVEVDTNGARMSEKEADGFIDKQSLGNVLDSENFCADLFEEPKMAYAESSPQELDTLSKTEIACDIKTASEVIDLPTNIENTSTSSKMKVLPSIQIKPLGKNDFEKMSLLMKMPNDLSINENSLFEYGNTINSPGSPADRDIREARNLENMLSTDENSSTEFSTPPEVNVVDSGVNEKEKYVSTRKNLCGSELESLVMTYLKNPGTECKEKIPPSDEMLPVDSSPIRDVDEDLFKSSNTSKCNELSSAIVAIKLASSLKQKPNAEQNRYIRWFASRITTNEDVCKENKKKLPQSKTYTAEDVGSFVQHPLNKKRRMTTNVTSYVAPVRVRGRIQQSKFSLNIKENIDSEVDNGCTKSPTPKIASDQEEYYTSVRPKKIRVEHKRKETVSKTVMDQCATESPQKGENLNAKVTPVLPEVQKSRMETVSKLATFSKARLHTIKNYQPAEVQECVETNDEEVTRTVVNRKVGFASLKNKASINIGSIRECYVLLERIKIPDQSKYKSLFENDSESIIPIEDRIFGFDNKFLGIISKKRSSTSCKKSEMPIEQAYNDNSENTVYASSENIMNDFISSDNNISMWDMTVSGKGEFCDVSESDSDNEVALVIDEGNSGKLDKKSLKLCDKQVKIHCKDLPSRNRFKSQAEHLNLPAKQYENTEDFSYNHVGPCDRRSKKNDRISTANISVSSECINISDDDCSLTDYSKHGNSGFNTVPGTSSSVKSNEMIHAKQKTVMRGKPFKKLKKRRLSRGKMEEERKFIESASQNRLECLLQGIETVPVSDARFKNYVHLVTNFLINPNHSPDVTALIFHVVKYLHLHNKENLLQNYLENPESCVFLPSAEICIVSALFEIEAKAKPYLHGLMRNIQPILYQLILAKKKLNLYGLASLCRVLTEICKRNGDKTQPLSLCCDLIKEKNIFATFLIATMVGVWNEIFEMFDLSDDMGQNEVMKKSKRESKRFTFTYEEEITFHGAIAFGAQKKTKRLSQPLFKSCTQLLLKYFPVPNISDVEKTVEFLKDRIHLRCMQKSFENSWKLTSALVIFASHETWNWTKNLIDEYIVPNLRKFSTQELNEQAFNLYCNLYVDLYQFCPEKLPDEILTKYFENKATSKGFSYFSVKFVQDYAAVSLMKFLVCRRKEIPTSLTAWFENNKDNPIVTVFENLFRRRLMSDNSESLALRDIICS